MMDVLGDGDIRREFTSPEIYPVRWPDVNVY